ncbi:MAG: TetR/AcrR family transcriptional regulator [Pseudomonadota bacterium]
MRHFWSAGYAASSMDTLVKATGVSRHGIYSDVGGKRELYLLGFAAYQAETVTPAFARVEQEDASLADVADYFETQIALAESIGLPGPGCLVANAMTETAPHDPDVAARVALHNARLKAGFRNVLSNEAPTLDDTDRDALADFLVVSTQGLWSMSRVVSDAAPLRRHAATLLSLLETRLAP